MNVTEEELDILMELNDGTKEISLSFGPSYVRLNKTSKNKWAIRIVRKHRKDKKTLNKRNKVNEY